MTIYPTIETNIVRVGAVIAHTDRPGGGSLREMRFVGGGALDAPAVHHPASPGISANPDCLLCGTTETRPLQEIYANTAAP